MLNWYVKAFDTLKGKWLKKLLLLMWQLSPPHRAPPLFVLQLANREPNASLWGATSSFLDAAWSMNWYSGLSIQTHVTWTHEEKPFLRIYSLCGFKALLSKHQQWCFKITSQKGTALEKCLLLGKPVHFTVDFRDNCKSSKNLAF